jgi:hypothetical protein
LQDGGLLSLNQFITGTRWNQVSVVLVVKVSEGLVLAADSAATITGQILDPDGKVVSGGVLKTYYTARKVIQIGDLPIGVLTWGQGNLGARTIESYVREWEFTNNWQSLEAFRKKHKGAQYSVKAFAEGLLRHLTKVHEQVNAHLPEDQRPGVGIIVAGYSEGAFFPEIWRCVIPHDTQPGASWFGLTDPIVRLHFGIDNGLMVLLSEKFGVPIDELREIATPSQHQIPFGLMPLQDAIDYANYLLDVAVRTYRFVIGPELVGGKVDIAIVTQRKFDWISHKSWGVRD